MQVSSVFLLISLFSLLNFLNFNKRGTLAIFLASTLFGKVGFQSFEMYLKIEFLTFIFFILFIIIHELYYKRTVTIKFDSRIIFIFYIFVSAFFAKIAYPETIVWPVGEHALSTNLENVFKDLILLKR